MSNILFINIGPVEIAILIAIPIIFLLVAIYQILNKETGLTKVLWIVVVLFFPYLGATIYFLSRYLAREKRRENRDELR